MDFLPAGCSLLLLRLRLDFCSCVGSMDVLGLIVSWLSGSWDVEVLGLMVVDGFT